MKRRTSTLFLSKQPTRLISSTFCFIAILLGLSGCGGSSGNTELKKNVLEESSPGQDVIGGQTSERDTAGGDTAGGDAAGGDAAGGDAAGGDAAGGDTAEGNSSGGDASEPTTFFSPSNFRVSITQSLATFNWDEVGSTEKYSIYLAKQSAQAPDSASIEILDNVVPPYMHTIQPGGTYFATITTTINGKESAHSAEIGINVKMPQNSGRLTRVSIANDGSELPRSKGSKDAAISCYGRYVAFSSFSNNVGPDDNNDSWDVFVRDREKGTTIRVSVHSDGTEGNGDSTQPALSISGNGKFVVFRSAANNLVTGDTNDKDDIFIYNLDTRKTHRVSVASNGSQSNGTSDYPAISFNGRFVAFRSAGDNLVENDKNEVQDIFIRDLVKGKTTRVSVTHEGKDANAFSGTPTISANGRYVAFRSIASNLVKKDSNFSDPDIFVRDLATNTTSIVSVPSISGQPSWGKNARNPAISSNGRYIAFQSDQKTLVFNDGNFMEDILLRDRQARTTTLLSINNSGTHGEAPSATPSISGDGRYVVFRSTLKNLVPNDKNNKADIFLAGS